MKRLAALALVAGTLILAGCSSINAGTITSKVYEPENYWTTQQCVSYNAKGVCTMWMPQTHYDDADYRFDIREGDENGWVYVSQDTFDRYEVGDYFAVDE